MSTIQLKQGIVLNYEKSGNGQAIVLIHGNGEDHTTFDQLVFHLEKDFCVYAVDSRGHGESSEGSVLDYQSICDDFVEFIHALRIEKPMVVGFSDGGIVGLMLATQHPDLLSKLVVCGANTRPTGIKKKWLRLMEKEYAEIHDPKLGMMLKQIPIEDDELRKVKIPVYVLAGSEDLIKVSHTKRIAKLLKFGELMILDGEDHGSYVQNGDKLYSVIEDFIKN